MILLCGLCLTCVNKCTFYCNQANSSQKITETANNTF